MKRRTIAAFFLVLCLVLAGCGGKSDATYALGDMEIPALPTDEEPKMDMYGNRDAFVRTYTEFTSVETILPDYVEQLINEYDFQMVTKALKTCEPPAEYGTEGDIYLGYPTGEEGEKTILLEIVWDPESCEVVSSIIPGPITEGRTSSNTVSYEAARDYMRSVDPGVLGLSGTSMSAYEVFAADGSILVNGQQCMCFNIYEGKDDASSGNQFQGVYLMSVDGQHLYRLDLDTNQVEAIDAPNLPKPGESAQDTAEDDESDAEDGEDKDDEAEKE